MYAKFIDENEIIYFNNKPVKLNGKIYVNPSVQVLNSLEYYEVEDTATLITEEGNTDPYQVELQPNQYIKTYYELSIDDRKIYIKYKIYENEISDGGENPPIIPDEPTDPNGDRISELETDVESIKNTVDVIAKLMY